MVMLLMRPIAVPTPEDIRAKVNLVLTMLRAENPEFDVEENRLIRHIESVCNVSIGREMVLQERGHEPWLPDTKARIEWKFWNRYRQYLLEEKCWTPVIVNRLD